MGKKRVLQLGKFYYPVKGGMEDHLFHLCNGLKEEYDLRVVVSNITNSTERGHVEGVDIVRVARLGELFSNSLCPSMHRWIRKFDPEIVHLHHPNPMAHLAYVLSRPKGKLVVMWHSDIIKQKILLKFYTPFLLHLLKKADRIIATSPAYIEYSSFLSRFKEKCRVIPLGIDLERFEQAGDTEKEVNEIRQKYGENIVLFVGRLTYYKGINYLIEAMKKTDATLLIIGEGPLGNKLMSQAQSSGAGDRIFFLRGVSHKKLVPYYRACDVFVLPSIARSEAFGVVQLEAMACGKPVISTGLKTGVPWVNRNNSTGIVVPPENPDALAEAIRTILEDNGLKKLYGENGRKRLEQEFTKEKVLERTRDLYNELLGPA